MPGDYLLNMTPEDTALSVILSWFIYTGDILTLPYPHIIAIDQKPLTGQGQRTLGGLTATERLFSLPDTFIYWQATGGVF